MLGTPRNSVGGVRNSADVPLSPFSTASSLPPFSAASSALPSEAPSPSGSTAAFVLQPTRRVTFQRSLGSASFPPNSGASGRWPRLPQTGPVPPPAAGIDGAPPAPLAPTSAQQQQQQALPTARSSLSGRPPRSPGSNLVRKAAEGVQLPLPPATPSGGSCDDASAAIDAHGSYDGCGSSSGPSSDGGGSGASSGTLNNRATLWLQPDVIAQSVAAALRAGGNCDASHGVSCSSGSDPDASGGSGAAPATPLAALPPGIPGHVPAASSTATPGSGRCSLERCASHELVSVHTLPPALRSWWVEPSQVQFLRAAGGKLAELGRGAR